MCRHYFLLAQIFLQQMKVKEVITICFSVYCGKYSFYRDHLNVEAHVKIKDGNWVLSPIPLNDSDFSMVQLKYICLAISWTALVVMYGTDSQKDS